MSDIFISYANEDRRKAQILAEALVQQGWSVWWDRTIPSGKRFDQVIQEALADARCVVVQWSKQSVTSDWVLEEAEEGRKLQILVPVLIEDVLPPMGFRRIQAADLMSWDGEGTSPAFQRLVGDIAAILGPPLKTLAPKPAPPRAKPPVEPPRPVRPPVPFRHLPVRKVLPWFIPIVLLVVVFAVFWFFQKPEPVFREENPLQIPDMLLVPARKFWMGCSGRGYGNCEDDEKPGGKLYLETFYVDKHEVTVAEYRKCVVGGICSSAETGREGCTGDKAGREDHPINCVDWNDAKTYCGWVGKRLPTEAEWEKAARGTDGRMYPWGNKWDSSRAAVGTRTTVSVGSYGSGVSPYGVYGMAGNVLEWTGSLYKPYPYKADDGREDPKAEGRRVLRGGSWYLSADSARASARVGWLAGLGGGPFGFRCAKTP